VRSWQGRRSATFRRTVAGIPVLGDRIVAALGADGRPNAVSVRIADGNVKSGLAPDFGTALLVARAFLDAREIREERDLGRVLCPLTGQEAPVLAPARQVEIRCDEPFGRWVVTVAAGGEVLRSRDRIRHHRLTGTVRTLADDFSYCDGVQELSSQHQYVTVHALTDTTLLTGADGSFSLPYDGAFQVTVSAQLAGPFALIDLHASEEDAFLSGVMTPGGWDFFQWNDGNSRQDERDAWTHVNRAHDVILAIDPELTDMDFAITTYVGRTDSYCPGNAWYDFGTLNFCDGDTPFANTATIGSIVYHEYCHAVTDKIYGYYDPPVDVDEASSDFYANLLTGDSVIARGYWQGACGTGVRNSDNNLVYPDDWTGHNHESGQILAGVFWDAWQGLADELPPEEALDLICSLWHGSRVLGQPMDMPESVAWLFVVDDDNGDLTDGTPHWQILAAAATAHGFEPPPINYGIEIVHEPISDGIPVDGAFAVTATVTSSREPLLPNSVRLIFSMGSRWFSVPLASQGDDLYSGEIPATLCSGSACYYLAASDVAGHTVTLPPEGPIAPYCFHVLGNTLVVFEDFEMDTGWTVGWPGDDAYSGVWEWADPDLVDGSGLISQPGDDYTPDPGHLCFVTGAAAGSGPGSYDVDGGTTSLVSPAYDLSGLETASVAFQAWIFSGFNTPDPEPLSLSVSPDSGESWFEIFSAIRQGGWQLYSVSLGVEAPLTDETRFKFVIQDPMPPALVEALIDEFTIFGCAYVDEEPPTVLITAPRPGNPLFVGTEVTIRWQAIDESDLLDCSVLLSRDGGESWADTLLWQDEFREEIDWVVTAPPSSEALFQVQVRDEFGNTGSDLSDDYLTIIKATPPPGKRTPWRTGLAGIHPNPFNPSTRVTFELARQCQVKIGVYDLTGRLVRELCAEPWPAGRHSVVWDGRDRAGEAVGSGIYLLSLQAGEYRATRKITLLK